MAKLLPMWQMLRFGTACAPIYSEKEKMKKRK
jgi:hypothetical protein